MTRCMPPPLRAMPRYSIMDLRNAVELDSIEPGLLERMVHFIGIHLRRPPRRGK